MAGLYLHIPFCSVKCHYCDFTAFSGQGRSTRRYLDCLEREAALAPAGPFSTLYIGGGTPSELESADLRRFLGWIASVWGGGAGFSESTFEANPESLDPEKIAALSRFGLKRLSLGLQAAQDRLLTGLGRKHDYKRFAQVYAWADEAFPSVNVDLMFDLPGQTLADWDETLDRVLGLEPEHISLYALRVEERTVLAKKGATTHEDLGAAMYERAVERVVGAGYHHYEISNFAKPGHESRHNIGYWRNEPYLGLGCGASSYWDGTRRVNAASLPGYCEALESGRLPVASEERLEGKERLGETILLGLRQVEGLDLSDEMGREFGGSFSRLKAQGLLDLEPSGRARLTPRGLLLSNLALQEFVAPFD